MTESIEFGSREYGKGSSDLITFEFPKMERPNIIFKGRVPKTYVSRTEVNIRLHIPDGLVNDEVAKKIKVAVEKMVDELNG